MIKKLLAKEPKAKGLSDSEFLENGRFCQQVTTHPGSRSTPLLRSATYPKEHINEQLLGRVNVFLN